MPRISKDPLIRMEEILDTAEALFFEHGYHETMVSDIVKKIGVAQGTFYYYFKSKEEILDALIGRQISKLTTQLESIVFSDTIIPPRKIELVLSIVFDTIHYKDGLLFDYLHNDRHLHLMDKLARQGKSFVAPQLMKIIEEGERLQYFKITHGKVALDFIMAIFDCTLDSLYEKSPAEVLRYQFEMAEALIQRTLGVPEGTIHIEVNKQLSSEQHKGIIRA